MCGENNSRHAYRHDIEFHRKFSTFDLLDEKIFVENFDANLENLSQESRDSSH
jgi:hypothetical protein